MYTLSDITRGLRNPTKIGRELNRLYHTRLKRWKYNYNGVDVFEEDWDTLVILDACRYDEFRRVHSLEGRLESRESRGSTSYEWVRGNFSNKELYDTVYVSSNLWYHRLESRIGADVHDLVSPNWTGGERAEFNYVAQEVAERDMHPETVTECALSTAERYPQKRLIVHYMQPHAPYIGPTGAEHFDDEGHLVSRIARGEVSTDRTTVRKAYRENLEIVLEHVADLIAELDGKTVVSADHGEMLGDRYRPFPFRDYGHNPGIYTPQLVKVPWFVSEGKQRRVITVEEPQERSAMPDETVVEDRLRELGYVP